MIHHPQEDDVLRQVGRPLLMMVITTLREDLDPVAIGMAVEQLILELESGQTEEYWQSARRLLEELHGPNQTYKEEE